MMELSELLQVLGEYAPLALAEEWDNVGMILQPLSISPETHITKVLLCNDLTVSVVREAMSVGARLVIAYHPALFNAVKRVTPDAGSRQIVALSALEAGIAVYCPHTAIDTMPGGINDWIAAGLGAGTCVPIKPRTAPPAIGGSGRLVTLDVRVSLEELAQRAKTHLGARYARVVRSPRPRSDKVKTVALCAGSGGSVVLGSGADVLLTGEMSHHEVLDASERGMHVVLFEHATSERGFLAVMRAALTQLMPAVAFEVSRADAELFTLL
eukprot:m51a1_g11677 hypothetical protein (269) ;mRNA; f:1824-2811